MSLYECVLIARQDISTTQVEGLVEQFSGIIEQGGGTVPKKEMWGLRTLAYRINKNRKGHYVLLNLDAPSNAVQEMERIMRLNEDVLRYLTLRVDALEEGPSIVAQGRQGRDDRGGRGGRGGGGFRDSRPEPSATPKAPEAPEAPKAPEAPEAKTPAAPEVAASESPASESPAEASSEKETSE